MSLADKTDAEIYQFFADLAYASAKVICHPPELGGTALREHGLMLEKMGRAIQDEENPDA